MAQGTSTPAGPQADTRSGPEGRTHPRESATDPAPAGRDAPPRRLRSSTVVLGGMGVLALALAACGTDPDRRCVDRESLGTDGYKVLGSKDCKPSGSGSGSGKGKASTAAGTTAARPAWYYGSEAHGKRAEGGTFSRDGAIQRGGLGCDDDDDDGSSGG